MIDTHCHFDMYPNPKEIIDDCENQGIITIGMTNLPSHFSLGYPHVKRYKKIRLALGMHPLMAEDHLKEFALFNENLHLTSYIGEVGLDFSREGFKTKQIQLDSFEKILKLVSGKKKVLSIHSRRAEKEVLSLLQKYKIKNAIFHWYSGGLNLIGEIVNSGYYFSINTAMINSESGRKIINRIPKEFILTETDGPYIQINNRVVKPTDIPIILNSLKGYYNLNIDQMEKQVETNFRRMIDRVK